LIIGLICLIVGLKCLIVDMTICCFYNIDHYFQFYLGKYWWANVDKSINCFRISPDDPSGSIYGKEHPSRVRGLSYVACPSFAFKRSTIGLSGINYASSNATFLVNVEDKVVQMESEFTTLKNQMQTFFAYIASRKDVSKHFAVMTTYLVHAFVNDE